MFKIVCEGGTGITNQSPVKENKGSQGGARKQRQ